ncbi:polysaccharide deacetylase family protein [Planococcus sp. FY231025]|uniref:polysaccharide deacetylase family protein n=1 Tax=Planococcus sp. FY231025 TaxID=3455699 RepID=UPI003F8DBE44
MKNYMKKQAQYALNSRTLIPLSKAFMPVFSGIGSVVMLHRVVADEGEMLCEDLEVTAAYLENTIRYFLREGYDIISLDAVHDILSGGREPDKKFVVFTFDDGYEDNYSIAYPIFKKYNAPFTVYVTTSFPDRQARLWWYALKDLVNGRDRVGFSWDGKAHIFPSGSPDAKKDAYIKIRQLVLGTATDQQEKLFSILFSANGISMERYVEELAMSWEQVRELAQDGLATIGAHTTNHFNLRNLTPEAVEKEMLDSKERIQSLTGQDVEHFAFPFGSENEAGSREFEIAGKLGFKTSTTTRCGNIFPGHAAHLNCLPRITPSPYLITTFPQYYATGFIPALKQKFKRLVTE